MIRVLGSKFDYNESYFSKNFSGEKTKILNVWTVLSFESDRILELGILFKFAMGVSLLKNNYCEQLPFCNFCQYIILLRFIILPTKSWYCIIVSWGLESRYYRIFLRFSNLIYLYMGQRPKIHLKQVLMDLE